ncbi:hypothetical protein EDD21DRAFT_209514 [Dissophora ornata]|nr:hypothetical protein EDD21DRAFT_209514 [Dissophora ornata]
MGTSHSSSRPGKESYGSSGQQYQAYTSSSAGSTHSKYASYNSSATALDRNQQSGGSSSPHISNHGSNSSPLQKALSRRRSSNRTTESSSSTHQHDSQHLPSHREEGVEEYVFRFGRRFHNTTSLYMLPNDSQEVDRLHEQHYIFKAALEKNIHVPIPDNGRVIDFGCGPATWAMVRSNT